MANNDLQDVFQFMAIRAGEKLDKLKARKSFIRDEAYYSREGSQIEYHLADFDADETNPLSSLNGIYDVDLFSSQSISPVGKIVYKHLVENNPKSITGNSRKRSKAKGKVSGPKSVEDKVEELLISGFEYDAFPNYAATPVIRILKLNNDLSQVDGFLLSYSSEKNTYKKGNSLLIFPDSLADIYTPLTMDLASVLKTAEAYIIKAKDDKGFKFDQAEFLELVKASTTVTSGPLGDMVFNVHGRYDADFLLSRRVLFDVLYGLYILRKRYTLSLEPAINGLKAMHLLEAVAITEFFSGAIKDKAYPSNSARFVSVLSSMYPLLAKWKPDSSNALEALNKTGVSLINSLEDIVELVQASPIVNPIFARFNNAFEPFNSIKPIGIGELKVVKQKFLGYRKGEIAHIETVLAGETKTRVHRVLEKAEDTFSFSSSNDSESTKDSQSTGRFELKNEAEQTMRSDLGINASTNFSYKGNPVIDASITAGMTYANSKTTSDKSSQNFVNEVIAKATSRIQSKVSQQRSQVRLEETEETNTHTFTNIPPKDNISGIYLWLEKVYQAQIHNFGKRLMFEFVLPEPAQYYVESKLYAYAASLKLPKYPDSEDESSTSTQNKLPVSSYAEITKDKYDELSTTYDLSNFPYPEDSIESLITNSGTQEANFKIKTKFGVIGEPPDKTETFTGVIPNLPAGYYLSSFRVSGSAKFTQINEQRGLPEHQNTIVINVSDRELFSRVDEKSKDWNTQNFEDSANYVGIPDNSIALANPFTIKIRSKTCEDHDLTFKVTLKRSESVLIKWQKDVYNELSRKAGSADSGSAQTQASKLESYKKELEKISAQDLNEIIKGKSSLWNEDTIATELKRQCISMVAKEFDSALEDDVTKDPATTAEELDVYYPTLQIKPGTETTDPAKNVKTIVEASARFDDVKDDPLAQFSLLDIEEARKKGRYIQFLEQAFEWNQLSYVFYPYFWASRPKWVELMNRDDQADALFTRFLQAGSSKVLLAVKPGYENAVLHFLATREPWEGGPSPVIGDPLYVPLYEEVRNQQDKLSGSEPVGEPWEFTLPTSLIYLESEQHKLGALEYKEKK